MNVCVAIKIVFALMVASGFVPALYELGGSICHKRRQRENASRILVAGEECLVCQPIPAPLGEGRRERSKGAVFLLISLLSSGLR